MYMLMSLYWPIYVPLQGVWLPGLVNQWWHELVVVSELIGIMLNTYTTSCCH